MNDPIPFRPVAKPAVAALRHPQISLPEELAAHCERLLHALRAKNQENEALRVELRRSHEAVQKASELIAEHLRILSRSGQSNI